MTKLKCGIIRIISVKPLKEEDLPVKRKTEQKPRGMTASSLEMNMTRETAYWRK